MQRKLLYHPTINNYLNEKDLNHKIEKILSLQQTNNSMREFYDKPITGLNAKIKRNQTY